MTRDDFNTAEPTIEHYGEASQGVTFTFTETEPDGGGELAITGHGAKEKEYLCDYFRKEVGKAHRYAPLLSEDPFTVTLKPSDLQYGRNAWYAFPVALDDQWFQPYKRLLARMTGYSGEIPDIAIGKDPRQLCPTHHRCDLRIEDGHVQATVFVSAHPWNKLDALTYGHKKAEAYLLGDLVGDPGYEPETIREYYGNGDRYRTVPNPRAHCKRPFVAKVASEEVWAAIWAWWVKTQASEAQLKVLAQAEACVDRFSRRDNIPVPYLGKYDRFPYSETFYALDPAGTCDYDGKGTMVKVWNWEEFAKLAGGL